MKLTLKSVVLPLLNMSYVKMHVTNSQMHGKCEKQVCVGDTASMSLKPCKLMNNTGETGRDECYPLCHDQAPN